MKSPGWLQDTYTGDMMTSAVQTKDILSTLHLSLSVVKERCHVDNLALFGSRARGDTREESDIDILVDFIPVPTFSTSPG